jgi:hypothetical protein
MPTTFTGASLSVARRRQLALFAWRAADQYSYNPLTQIREQRPSYGNRDCGPSASVVLGQRLGGQLIGQQAGADNGTCNCSTAVTLQGYVKQSPAMCGGSGNA